MSIATDVPQPHNENVIAEIHPIGGRYPLVATMLIAISLLATLLWSGALVWLLSEFVESF